MIDGYRLAINRYPGGSQRTAYFQCVIKTCNGKAATTGDLHQDTIQIRFHNKAPNIHNHGPDVVGNIVKKHLHNIRLSILTGDFKADQSQRVLYDRLTEEKLESLPGPLKEEFVQRLPSLKSIMMTMYRNKTKRFGKSPRALNYGAKRSDNRIGKEEQGKKGKYRLEHSLQYNLKPALAVAWTTVETFVGSSSL